MKQAIFVIYKFHGGLYDGDSMTQAQQNATIAFESIISVVAQNQTEPDSVIYHHYIVDHSTFRFLEQQIVDNIKIIKFVVETNYHSLSSIADLRLSLQGE